MTVAGLNATLISENQQNKSKNGTPRQEKRPLTVVKPVKTQKIDYEKIERDIINKMSQSRNNDKRNKEAIRAMKIPEAVMLKANNADIKQDTPLFEKIVRTYFDPAHAGNFARAPMARDRTAIKSCLTKTSLTTVAGQPTWIIATPYLECPFIKSLDGGNTWTAILSGGFDLPHIAYAELKAEAVMGIGKGMKITFDTPEMNRQDMFIEGRLDPVFNNYEPWSAKYAITGAAAITDISSGNHIAAKQLPVNQRVLQNIPVFPDTLGPLVDEKRGGSYLVNTLSEYRFNYQTDSTDTCLYNDANIKPLNTTQMNALRLGFLGQIAADGSKFVTYGTAEPYGAAANVVVSKPLMFDMTFFYIPAKLNAQSISFEGFEHYQYITADTDVLTSPLIVQPYDMPNIEIFMRKMSNEMPFSYPPEFNDWGTVWKWIKNKASQVGDFYKANKEILKPVASLVPGASMAIDLADRFI